MKIRYLSILCALLLAGCGQSNSGDKPSPSPAPGVESPPAPDGDELFAAEGSTPSAKGRFHVKLHWMAGPVVGAPNAFHLIVSDGLRLLPKSVEIDQVMITMPMMGHGPRGTPRIMAEEGMVHMIMVDGFEFNMAGLWRITVEAVVDGHRDQAVVEFRL